MGLFQNHDDNYFVIITLLFQQYVHVQIQLNLIIKDKKIVQNKPKECYDTLVNFKIYR